MAKHTTTKKQPRGRKRRPQHKSLLRLIIPHSPEEQPYYDFEIGEKEYAALGFAIVHWGFFEDILYGATAKLARRAGKKVPLDAKSLDFSRRLTALERLVKRMRDPLGIKKGSLLELIPKIANANGIRQKLVHGLWSFDPKKPERLYSRSRRALPFKTRLEPFDFPSLIKFALSVGELSFVLDAASSPLRLPEGEPKPYASRSFLLALQGKDPASLGFHWPTPLESPHRRISYPASPPKPK